MACIVLYQQMILGDSLEQGFPPWKILPSGGRFQLLGNWVENGRRYQDVNFLIIEMVFFSQNNIHPFPRYMRRHIVFSSEKLIYYKNLSWIYLVMRPVFCWAIDHALYCSKRLPIPAVNIAWHFIIPTSPFSITHLHKLVRKVTLGITFCSIVSFTLRECHVLQVLIHFHVSHKV